MINQPSVLYRMNRSFGLTSPYQLLAHTCSVPPSELPLYLKIAQNYPLAFMNLPIIYSRSFCCSSFYAAALQAFAELEKRTIIEQKPARKQKYVMLHNKFSDRMGVSASLLVNALNENLHSQLAYGALQTFSQPSTFSCFII